MRLLLIMLVAGLMAGCSLLDKTPKEAWDDGLKPWITSVLEARNDVASWIASLSDDRITVGDIIIYIIAGLIILSTMKDMLGSIGDAINDRRRRKQGRAEIEQVRDNKAEAEDDRSDGV